MGRRICIFCVGVSTLILFDDATCRGTMIAGEMKVLNNFVTEVGQETVCNFVEVQPYLEEPSGT